VVVIVGSVPGYFIEGEIGRRGEGEIFDFLSLNIIDKKLRVLCAYCEKF